ncbi:MAG: D-alanyl-lipoteichoic acid biosynthesis protein DltD [Chthoniobacteraceae bacterium]
MTAPSTRQHLQAFGIAAGFAMICALAAVLLCAKAEDRYIHNFADEFGDLKLQGVALQKTAFTQPDLLVLYGSSELVSSVPTKASEFFQKYEAGFRVFPVGKPGTSSLAIMEKIASLGRYIQGRKVAFTISPSYFFSEKLNQDYYEGNFSGLQAMELAFSTHLTPDLKRDAARRMIEYPDTMEGNWTLEFGLRRLAGDTFLDHALYAAIWPLGKLANAVGRAQDHIEAGLHIAESMEEKNPKPHRIPGLNWKEILRKTSVKVKATRPPIAPRLTKRPKGSRDAAFLKILKVADEWEDFGLLLRTLKEMHADALLISMPLHGPDLETTGVSADARKAYGVDLKKLARKYGVQLVYFSQYENDPTFFADNMDHPGERGWMLFNKVLDDFFHKPQKKLK